MCVRVRARVLFLTVLHNPETNTTLENWARLDYHAASSGNSSPRAALCWVITQQVVVTQRSGILIYFAAAAWNHAKLDLWFSPHAEAKTRSLIPTNLHRHYVKVNTLQSCGILAWRSCTRFGRAFIVTFGEPQNQPGLCGDESNTPLKPASKLCFPSHSW